MGTVVQRSANRLACPLFWHQDVICSHISVTSRSHVARVTFLAKESLGPLFRIMCNVKGQIGN